LLKSNRRILFVMGALIAANMVNQADRAVMGILLPLIKTDLSLSDTAMGVLSGVAFSGVYAVGAFVFGHAADSRSRTRLIALGLVFWSLATAASGLAVDFKSMFWARFFTGLGEASLYPCAISLIATTFPQERRGRAVGIFGAGATFGSAIGIAAGGLLAEQFGWRSVFYLYGGAGLLVAPLVLMIQDPRRGPANADGEKPGVAIRRLLADRRLQLVWLTSVLGVSGLMGYSIWAAAWFLENGDMTITDLGYIFGVAMILGGLLGGYTGGALADNPAVRKRGGEAAVAVGGLVVMAVMLAVVLWTPWQWMRLGVALLLPIPMLGFFPPLVALVARLVPTERLGLAFALNVFFVGGIGNGVGPWLVGAVSDATGSLQTGISVSLVLVVSAIPVGLAMLRATRA